MREGKSAMPEVKSKIHHRTGKATLDRCSMCKHLKLDPNWERLGLESDWRNICSNEKSLSFEMHVNFQESCGKFEKNENWKRWSYKTKIDGEE